ncbi:MAG TPA: hypothetical protein VF506_00420 [Streptosporangiaceae bacterium]
MRVGLLREVGVLWVRGLADGLALGPVVGLWLPGALGERGRVGAAGVV